KHQDQLDADQHHADAHASFERDFVNRIGLAAQAGKCSARVGKRVHANAEPGHAVAAGDADHAEEQDDEDAHGLIFQEQAKIEHDDDCDESLEQEDEFSLSNQVRLARLVNQLGDFVHRSMHGKIFQALINGSAKGQAENAEEDAEEEQFVAVHAEKIHLREIGKRD